MAQSYVTHVRSAGTKKKVSLFLHAKGGPSWLREGNCVQVIITDDGVIHISPSSGGSLNPEEFKQIIGSWGGY